MKAVASHRLVLLGPPASGKGTQGRLIEKHWKVPVISIGEVLRREITEQTASGREAASFIDSGRLVPDRVAVAAAEAWLVGSRVGESFAFDGFPRTVGQAHALEQVLARLGKQLTAVIWLELEDGAIAERVGRRVTCADCARSFQVGWQVSSREDACPVCRGCLTVRKDDDPTMLAERMNQYRQHTAPVREFYSSRRLLHIVEGGLAAEEVFAQIGAVTAQPQEVAA